MQTMAVEVQDDYVNDFMNYVNNHSDRITISKDKNLEYDPYFYERQKELQKDLEDIENGKAEFLTQEQYDDEMNTFFKELKSKYDN
ncbi:hypothetical protein [Sulfurimonas sp.]|uniref:hypothetical protein n=1 Tax=Sulfurimonas sp. TaxID=2022749 RepID=UPI002AB05DA8|nr:hypothetical protein [Sulfurimonas sp.]